MTQLSEALSQNSYPGRGILLGKSEDGQSAVIAYFIMGRSVNSRNRVFVAEGDALKTRAFDESKLTDPSLIIYAPVRVLGDTTIVTNGGQTDTIYDALLAGGKADNWFLRQHPKVLGLQFQKGLGRANRDNAIDLYIGPEWEDVLGDDVWQNTFTVRPEPLTEAEKKAWLGKVTGVTLGSDAFFPFGDNIERARRSGVTAIVQPGGSIRDQQVIDTCNKYGIAMAFCGIRLFHH